MDDYGGRFQIVGRRVFPKGRKKGQKKSKIILYLSTRKLSAMEVIEERRDRWRIENAPMTRQEGGRARH